MHIFSLLVHPTKKPPRASGGISMECLVLIKY